MKIKLIHFGRNILDGSFNIKLGDVVSDSQAARYLGITLCKLRKLMRGGKIPFYHMGSKKGGIFLFEKKDLNRYKDRVKIKPKNLERCL
jgi:excisionase family DNA binding protein